MEMDDDIITYNSISEQARVKVKIQWPDIKSC